MQNVEVEFLVLFGNVHDRFLVIEAFNDQAYRRTAFWRVRVELSVALNLVSKLTGFLMRYPVQVADGCDKSPAPN
jgi:hypothetical protein